MSKSTWNKTKEHIAELETQVLRATLERDEATLSATNLEKALKCEKELHGARIQRCQEFEHTNRTLANERDQARNELAAVRNELIQAKHFIAVQDGYIQRANEDEVVRERGAAGTRIHERNRIGPHMTSNDGQLINARQY